MKKGFTLIELLAVIVILAIISVVVTPIISGVINDAKKEAAERSVEGYIKAINIAQIKYQSKFEGKIAKTINDLSVEASDKDRITTKKIEFAKTGVVVNGTFVLDGFKCNYSSNTAKCRKLVGASVNVFTHVINNTWEEINEISAEIALDESITSTTTTAHGYSIGDMKDFKVGEEVVTAVIIGFNHDVENGETGITFICKYGNVTQRMTSSGNTGGYKASEMYTYLSKIVLPFEVKTVKKEVDSGYPNFEVSLSDETKWLLSYQETGTTYTGNDGIYQKPQGTPYPYLSSDSIRQNLSKSTYWWTRSTFTNTAKLYYWAVGKYGWLGANLSSGIYSAYGEPYRAYSIIFAFNI